MSTHWQPFAAAAATGPHANGAAAVHAWTYESSARASHPTSSQDGAIGRVLGSVVGTRVEVKIQQYTSVRKRRPRAILPKTKNRERPRRVDVPPQEQHARPRQGVRRRHRQLRRHGQGPEEHAAS